MQERRDDITKPEGESRPERAPGSYYYDDATGYEIYSPEEDDEEEEGGQAPLDGSHSKGGPPLDGGL